MSEYWDILDADGEKTGKRVKRERFGTLGVGQYHLVVHVWITNSSGEFLIQKRSRNKQPMPGEWGATSGSVKSGEDSRTAAIRELYEELGIPVKPGEIFFVERFRRKNSISDIWHVGVDADINSLTLQKEEVSAAMWVTPDELKRMIKKGEFHNYGMEYFDTVFSLIKG